VAESRVLQPLGAWAEVVSGREYRLANRLGYAGERIVFNGPYKPDAELRTALSDGALIHVNDLGELERLLALVSRHGPEVRIGLRVRTEVAGLGHSRFGLSLERGEADAAAACIASVPGIALAGYHLHLKGDTDDPELYREGARRLAQFLARRAQDNRHQPIRSLDLGGGFPAHGPKPRSRAQWSPRPIEAYVRAITDELATVFPDGDRPTLILEPGRYLVADAFVFVCEVVRVSSEGGVQMVTGNGAITMLPLIHYCPQVVRAFSPDLEPRDDGGTPAQSVIFGASCREDDVMYHGLLPPVRTGDLLAFYAVGAYNSTLSPQFIFETPQVVFA
jgi:diaminopimelate decarboxylase